MNWGITYSFAFFGSLAAAAGLTPLAIALANRCGLVDLPDVRRVHRTPTPRIGGTAIAVGMALTFALLLLFVPAFREVAVVGRVSLVTLGGAAAFLLITGFVDDALTVSSKYKLLALILASLAFCASGGLIDSVALSGRTLFSLGWASWPVTILWIIGVTVSLNFIDGMDGLAGGIAAIAAGVLGVATSASGQVIPCVLALTLAGSLGGFLIYNRQPAKIFMGDCGSMFVGFTLAAVAVCASHGNSVKGGIILPALTLAIPFLDTALTMVRRVVLQRRSVFSAERGHVHHRLLDIGLCHRHVVMALHGVTLIAAAISVLAMFGTRWMAIGGLGILIPIWVILFRRAGSVRLRETVAALRRNRAIAREANVCRKAFEEIQLRFRLATNFDTWWHEVCHAAQMLGCLRITLPLITRDGVERVMHWSATGAASGQAAMTAMVPVPQRRADTTLVAELQVGVEKYLECAGQRVALFSRLMGEHGLASLGDEHLRSSTASAAQLPAAPRIAALEIDVDPHAPQSIPGSEDLTDPNVNAAEIGVPFAVADANPSVPRVLGHQPDGLLGALRVAIVHDFLYTYAGAERVLEQMIKVFPQAELFSLFDFLPAGKRDFIANKPVTTSFIQRMPMARKKHRAYLPFMPMAIEQLDVSNFDLVISSSYMAAKGVLTRPNQLHICYCHSPPRFAWDLQNQYLGQTGLTGGIKSIIARTILHYIRGWDVRSANGVDVFVSNSHFVSRRIDKVYRKASTPVYPPVDTDQFTPRSKKENFYLTASRMVPYKRIDLIVEAFSKMPEKRLVVVGEGPELDRIRAKAGPNVRLVGHQPAEKLKNYMQLARAFIFAAEEDFGIAPVEAQACGTPVIAFGSGGVRESVIHGQTGLFFAEQTCESLIAAVQQFERAGPWDADACRRNAERFSPACFRERFTGLVRREWAAFVARSIPALLPLGYGERDELHAAALETPADDTPTYGSEKAVSEEELSLTIGAPA